MVTLFKNQNNFCAMYHISDCFSCQMKPGYHVKRRALLAKETKFIIKLEPESNSNNLLWSAIKQSLSTTFATFLYSKEQCFPKYLWSVHQQYLLQDKPSHNSYLWLKIGKTHLTTSLAINTSRGLCTTDFVLHLNIYYLQILGLSQQLTERISIFCGKYQDDFLNKWLCCSMETSKYTVWLKVWNFIAISRELLILKKTALRKESVFPTFVLDMSAL